MSYINASKAGLGDPYWYEWSVGLNYIIDMINPDSDIDYVELQADVSLGLDDVVVTYKNGTKLFIQVKHTRVENTLTFGNLVSSSSESKMSLLHDLADAWNKEKGKYASTKVLLYTNRSIGEQSSSTRGESAHVRPALKSFLPLLKEKIQNAEKFSDIQFPEYEQAWNEWTQQLECIDKEEDKLSFLRTLVIDTDSPGLEEIQKILIEKIKSIFQTTDIVADLLLGRLDHRLRTWVTSARGENTKIDIEELYDALSITTDIKIYNHDLVPCTPFFDSRISVIQSLESEIATGSHNIIFLSGIAGTGKTNIISKLSNKKESTVDIRYYAYEPINPNKEYNPGDVSQRVDKECFWNELLNQLRRKLKGQLSKYTFPVCNDLLTLEEKKRTFFNIASQYATDRGKPFVIAIDGIDHAARASVVENTFLPTLPHPDYIPENVKLLIAGQPKENYKQYPSWLYEDKGKAIEINIPGITLEDIRLLVDNQFGDTDAQYKQQLSALISIYAEGNTLAAVFATYEATKYPELAELESQLKNRNLSGNIKNYYETIWNNAIEKINYPFVDYKIAGVCAFFNEPINENKLSSIFASERISVSDWKNVLKALHPLMQENDGNYTVLHNDIRVFLSGIIQRDHDHVKEIYNNIADYYLNLPQKNIAYYRDVIWLLHSAGRICDYHKVLSTEYIIEAYVKGLSIDELNDNIFIVLKSILSQERLDYSLMRSVSFCYFTINQIERSQDEIENLDFRVKSSVVDTHPFECYVTPNADWDDVLINDVLSFVKRLYESGLYDRAAEVFERWFSGTGFDELVAAVDAGENKVSSLRNMAEMLGEYIVLFNAFDIIKMDRDVAEEHSEFVKRVTDSALITILEHYSGTELNDLVQKIPFMYPDTIVKCISMLLDGNRISDMKELSRALRSRMEQDPLGKLFLAFMQIIASELVLSPIEKASLWQQIKVWNPYKMHYENQMSYLGIYAFVASFLQPESYQVVAHQIITDFQEANSGHAIEQLVPVYLNHVCLLGEWMAYRQKGNDLLPFQIDDVKRMMDRFFVNQWKPGIYYTEICKLRSYILKAYIWLSKTCDRAIRESIEEACQTIFDSNPAGSIMDAGFYFYKDNHDRIVEWYEYWLSDDGLAWTKSIYERNSIIQHFLDLIKLYKADEYIDTSAVIDKACWSIIGYSSHKDYSGDYLQKWYTELIEKQGCFDGSLAKTIKEISDKSEATGDNRLCHIINCKVYEDIFSCGYDAIGEIYHNNHYLCECLEYPEYFVYGLIGLVKNDIVDRISLLKIWGIGVGLLDWRDANNHVAIGLLQNAIESCAGKLGISDIHESMSHYAPAYMDLYPNNLHSSVPEIWRDENGDLDDSLISDDIIIQYLDGQKSSEKDVSGCISIMAQKDKVNKDLLFELLDCELHKKAWNPEYNTIIPTIFKTLPLEETEPIIHQYFSKCLADDEERTLRYLPALSLWVIPQLDESYAKDGMDELVHMHRMWMSSVNHFHEPEIKDNNTYIDLIDWENITDVYSLFYQILKILILSENADAARTALSGLVILEQLDVSFLSAIERDWDQFHYRAKEWLLMGYELLWDFTIDRRETIKSCVKVHCSDECFNAALYANLLMENMDEEYTCEISEQPFFSKVPSYGNKRFIKAPQSGHGITGTEMSKRIVQELTDLLEQDCSDLEGRTLEYAIAENCISLIPIKRHQYGYRVEISSLSRALLDVLYNDWYMGRWNGLENELARIVLSASEPYALFVSPPIWPFNDHTIPDNRDQLHTLGEKEKREICKSVLSTGINNEEEIVIAGSFYDYYPYKKMMVGYCVSYIDYPGWRYYAANQSEHNARFFLMRRKDYVETDHYNISLQYSGVESFRDSHYLFGISKKALNNFGWAVTLDSYGFRLINKNGEQIGRHEYYYGQKDYGSRDITNQPLLQRWIIKRKALEETTTGEHLPTGVLFGTITVNDNGD